VDADANLVTQARERGQLVVAFVRGGLIHEPGPLQTTCREH
jgi:hypothetical protein